jgi:hypothetical protein
VTDKPPVDYVKALWWLGIILSLAAFWCAFALLLEWVT